MGETENVYKCLVRTSYGKRPLAKPRHSVRILNWTFLANRLWGCELDSPTSESGTSVSVTIARLLKYSVCLNSSCNTLCRIFNLGSNPIMIYTTQYSTKCYSKYWNWSPLSRTQASTLTTLLATWSMFGIAPYTFVSSSSKLCGLLPSSFEMAP